jgi:CHAT domain-containing protein
MVSPTTGFTLVDERSKRMTVFRDDQTLPVKFDLLASTAGKGTAKVYAFRDGTCVASLSVSADIVVTTPEPTNHVPASLPLPAAVKADTDLDLMVFKESYRGGIALTYRLTDRANVSSSFGPHTLDSDPSAYVHAKFAEIQEINRTAKAWGNAERIRLERIGSELYESLVPPDLQEVLWNSDRVRSFLVQTEEPWIPWELCRMTITRGDGSTEARGFLCDLYELSRWLPGTPPKTALRATRIGVIAPSDRWLPSAPAEVEMLKALSASGPEVDRVTATYVSVIEALQSHQYDVLHFVGHGKNLYPQEAERSEFLLSGRWRLRPTDISGETKNFGLASPVVFMNACEVAQASMGLHGIGGWASAMTKAGAGAFIGTHWDVRDDLAETFAATFYAKLVGSPTMTIAGAAHAARQVLKQRPDSDATWLAYAVHASPGATCSFSSPTP